MSTLNHVAAVVRCYNNPNIEKAVARLRSAGVGKVIVITDALKDAGNTRGWLGSHLGANRGVELIEMYEGYSWSNALNRALASIRLGNLEAELTGAAAYSVMLNVSVEALFTMEHLMTMAGALERDDRVAVVGTSFTGRQNSNAIDLGRSYMHPRNTGMMLRINALTASCSSFDSWCDDVGGMEDIEFILRLSAFSDRTIVMLDLHVPLVVGVNHHQPTKEAREQEAIEKIVARMRVFRSHIESVITDMHLEA